MKRLLIATAFVLSSITLASAHGHRHHHIYRVHDMGEGLAIGLGHMLKSMDSRPHAWCGWYMRSVLGVSDPSYNLARNWEHYGRPAMGPSSGVIVVWPHHVGRIVGRADNGLWLVESGNDGHAVRTRPRSLAGAIAFREP